MPACSSPPTNLHISHVCPFLFSPFCLLATGTFSPGADVTAPLSGGRDGAPGGRPEKSLPPEQSFGGGGTAKGKEKKSELTHRHRANQTTLCWDIHTVDDLQPRGGGAGVREEGGGGSEREREGGRDGGREGMYLAAEITSPLQFLPCQRRLKECRG